MLEAHHGKTPVVILVAKNGAITVDHTLLGLKQLVPSLNGMGVSATSKIVVRGEEGTNFKEISRVLDTLVAGGLLPKDAID